MTEYSQYSKFKQTSHFLRDFLRGIYYFRLWMLDYDFKANYKSVPDTSTLRRENYKRFGGTTGKYHINTRTLSFHWYVKILDGSCQANTHWHGLFGLQENQLSCKDLLVFTKSSILQQNPSLEKQDICIARERKKQNKTKKILFS